MTSVLLIALVDVFKCLVFQTPKEKGKKRNTKSHPHVLEA